jgi:hypothetical protein
MGDGCVWRLAAPARWLRAMWSWAGAGCRGRELWEIHEDERMGDA